MKYKELFKFIHERHRVWWRKAAGIPKPWTKDPILQQYRFCNVYREKDTVTEWIASSWREPHKEDHHLWFAMVVARLVNWPDTLAELDTALGLTGNSITWHPDRFLKVMHSRKERGEKVFSGAYIVSTSGRAMDKAEYLVEHVLNPLWFSRKKIAPTVQDTLDSFHQRLMQFDGLGSFLAAQVVADMKYVSPLKTFAVDWWSWAASGPGSRRGLNRVMGFDVDAPWGELAWREQIVVLMNAIAPLVEKSEMPRLHMQDLQNCLCEYDKWCRVKNGEGRPRSKYPGV